MDLFLGRQGQLRMEIVGVEECVRLEWEGRLRLSNMRFQDERVIREKLETQVQLLRNNQKQICDVTRMKNVYGDELDRLKKDV